MKASKNGRHPFKWMKYDGRNVRIDKDIATLLSKMWKLGIHTTNSCQANCSFACNHKLKTTKYKNGTSYTKKIKTKNCHNNVWLAFDSVKDVELLYNLLAEYVPYSNKNYNTSMYHKMSCDLFIRENDRPTLDGWCFRFYMCNRGTYGHWGRPKWGSKRSTCVMWVEDGCDKNDFVMEPQITFPRTHLQYVESRLDIALTKKKK